MSRFEKDYKALLNKALLEGAIKTNRTNVSTLSLFNETLTINLTEGFPVITGKKIQHEKAFAEFYWMIMGLSTTKFLNEHDIHWWDPYADSEGDLRLSYGTSLRNFGGENNKGDQLEYVIKELNKDGNSRRAHISLWEADRLDVGLLPPCLTGFTFYKNKSTLNMTLQLRSSDLFLGLPYDIILAALLLQNVASSTKLVPIMLGIQITDAHIYSNHMDSVSDYLRSKIYELPESLVDYNSKLATLIKYKHGPYIKVKMNN